MKRGILFLELITLICSSCFSKKEIAGTYYLFSYNRRANTLISFDSTGSYIFASKTYPLGKLNKAYNSGNYKIKGKSIILNSYEIPYLDYKPYKVQELQIEGLEQILITFRLSCYIEESDENPLSETQVELHKLFVSKKVLSDNTCLNAERWNKSWAGIQSDTLLINEKALTKFQPIISQVVYPEYKIKDKRSNFFVVTFDTLYEPTNKNRLYCFFDEEVVKVKNRKIMVMPNLNKILRLNFCKACLEDSSFNFSPQSVLKDIYSLD